VASDRLVRPASGPLAFMSRGELGVIDARGASVDAMSEADPGGKHAGKDVVMAGQGRRRARRPQGAAVTRIPRRLAAYAAVVALLFAVGAGLAACVPPNTSSGTTYFGTCPAGDQYPVQVQPNVWKCENP
jgi:hypothetical protein